MNGQAWCTHIVVGHQSTSFTHHKGTGTKRHSNLGHRSSLTNPWAYFFLEVGAYEGLEKVAVALGVISQIRLNSSNVFTSSCLHPWAFCDRSLKIGGWLLLQCTTFAVPPHCLYQCLKGSALSSSMAHIGGFVTPKMGILWPIFTAMSVP